jgi:hypothetical protein
MTFDQLNNLKAVARKYGGLNQGEVDQLIATAERHLASAEQLRRMREALEQTEALVFAWMAVYQFNHQLKKPHQTHADIYNDLKAAVAIAPSQAEQQARENAEKAALLEWWFDESNEEARDTIRVKRSLSDSLWTAQQWIEAVRTAKEASNEN